MSEITQTDRHERPARPLRVTPSPGLVLLFAGGRPACEPIAVGPSGVELGRCEGSLLQDASISRRHARVSRSAEGWTVQDLDSRNGTFLDGVRVQGQAVAGAPRVLRLGSALFLFASDVGPFAQRIEPREGVVAGPAFRAVLERVAQLAAAGSGLHLTGESGAGKEIAARAFHAAGARGPFVAVNCAAIPAGLAERLLFGARKGAFSGAEADAPGYLEAAHQGTLFLDEVGELELQVQAKLLRALESREVLPLGAVKARPVELRLCSASLRDLGAEVAAGRFRPDLFFRLGQPAVRVPPLRERPEEIPWHVEALLRSAPTPGQATASLVEACLLRPWPGNVRELQHAVREAHSRVVGTGEPVQAGHLPAGPRPAATEPLPEPAHPQVGTPDHRAWVEEALRTEGGNVSGAARRLGIHRTQLRRWIERYRLDEREPPH